MDAETEALIRAARDAVRRSREARAEIAAALARVRRLVHRPWPLAPVPIARTTGEPPAPRVG